MICTEGPLLIVAGAGSGKTRVLTHRIAYIIKEKHVSPFNVLAVTFTNKAANEMKHRLKHLLGVIHRDMWIGTFHSICARILRQHINNLGWDKNYSIFDEDDQTALMRAVLKEAELSEKRFRPGAVLAAVSRAKNELVDCDLYAKRAEGYFEENVAIAYRIYQEKLFKNNALDFDDLLMFTIELFDKTPKVLAAYQDRFRYVSVDEYQDTNRAQYLLTNMLAKKHKNLCVVGDSDQSIYSWRGADFRNILNFESDYPKAKVVVLEQNYRSSQHILDVANQVIKNNALRKPKNLWTANPLGDQVIHFISANEEDEANYLAEQVKKLSEHYNYSGFAVLYRTNAQSRILEETFLREGIPYRILSGVRFYERKEIKDILAYLRVIVNPSDNISMARLLNMVVNGIGKITLEKISKYALQSKQGLYQACCNIEAIKLPPGITKEIRKFIEFINAFKKQAEVSSAAEVVNRLIIESGYKKQFEEEGTDESLSRAENIEELVSVAREFEKHSDDVSLASFLAQVSLVTDQDTQDNKKPAVTLMTLHSAKGLEFPVVFLVGLDEGVFPHYRSMHDQNAMEEERRLCYVGITRSQKRLFLISAVQRILYGENWNSGISRFVSEISPKNLLVEQSRLLNEHQRVKTEDEKIILPEISIGDEVEHPKWGKGEVVALSDECEEAVALVNFYQAGKKNLLLRYAPIKKITL